MNTISLKRYFINQPLKKESTVELVCMTCNSLQMHNAISGYAACKKCEYSHYFLRKNAGDMHLFSRSNNFNGQNISIYYDIMHDKCRIDMHFPNADVVTFKCNAEEVNDTILNFKILQ